MENLIRFKNMLTCLVSEARSEQELSNSSRQVSNLVEKLRHSSDIALCISPEVKAKVDIPWVIFEVRAFDWIDEPALVEIINVDLPRWLVAFDTATVTSDQEK